MDEDHARRPPAAEDIRALNDAASRLYARLKSLAAKLRWPGANASLHATSLVNEAYLKLARSRGLALKPSEEIFAAFAVAMRQILVDAARRKQTQKRGGGALIPLQIADLPGGEPISNAAAISPEDVMTLEKAMGELEREDPRQAIVINCRFYLGMTVDEVAALLDLSKATVEREERRARAILSSKVRPKEVRPPE